MKALEFMWRGHSVSNYFGGSFVFFSLAAMAARAVRMPAQAPLKPGGHSMRAILALCDEGPASIYGM